MCGEHYCRFLQAIWGSQYQRGRCLLLWQLEPPAAGHIVWEGWRKERFWQANWPLYLTFTILAKRLISPAFSQKFKTGPNTKGTDPWNLTLLPPFPLKPHASSNKYPTRSPWSQASTERSFASTFVVLFVTSCQAWKLFGIAKPISSLMGCKGSMESSWHSPKSISQSRIRLKMSGKHHCYLNRPKFNLDD